MQPITVEWGRGSPGLGLQSDCVGVLLGPSYIFLNVWETIQVEEISFCFQENLAFIYLQIKSLGAPFHLHKKMVSQIFAKRIALYLYSDQFMLLLCSQANLLIYSEEIKKKIFCKNMEQNGSFMYHVTPLTYYTYTDLILKITL